MNRRQFEKVVEPLRIVSLLGSLMFLTFETYWLENTIRGLHLFWVTFGIGCLLGFIPSVAFGYFHHDLLGGLVGPVARTSQFAITTALTLGLLFPAGASMLNRKVIATPEHTLAVVVAEKCLGGKARSTPYLFILSSPDVSERIEVDRPFFDRVSVGNEISLTLSQGILGYQVVRAWSAPNPPLQGTLRDEAPRSAPELARWASQNSHA